MKKTSRVEPIIHRKHAKSMHRVKRKLDKLKEHYGTLKVITTPIYSSKNLLMMTGG